MQLQVNSTSLSQAGSPTKPATHITAFTAVRDRRHLVLSRLSVLDVGCRSEELTQLADHSTRMLSLTHPGLLFPEVGFVMKRVISRCMNVRHICCRAFVNWRPECSRLQPTLERSFAQRILSGICPVFAARAIQSRSARLLRNLGLATWLCA